MLSAFYKTYFPRLVAGLRATYGSGPPDPDEVAQAAFEKLNKRERLDDIRDLESYVWIAARNIIMSAKRAERVREHNRDEVEDRFFSYGQDTFDPERVFIAKEQLAVIMRVVRAMPERRQRIFLLNRLHGMTPEKAGQACGVSRSSAVRHIGLATAAIAEALADSGRDPEGDGS
ncbi:MAG: sigma-70 family RNA polymerase sigma factor [Pseudomonadota bacterium]